jgi:hypothetical protein
MLRLDRVEDAKVGGLLSAGGVGVTVEDVAAKPIRS